MVPFFTTMISVPAPSSLADANDVDLQSLGYSEIVCALLTLNIMNKFCVPQKLQVIIYYNLQSCYLFFIILGVMTFSGIC